MAAPTDGVLFRRIKLLGEIASTERTYVATLHTLLHVFVRPLEQHGLHAPLDPGTSLIFKCGSGAGREFICSPQRACRFSCRFFPSWRSVVTFQCC
jgi:hypothetical protein